MQTLQFSATVKKRQVRLSRPWPQLERAGQVCSCRGRDLQGCLALRAPFRWSHSAGVSGLAACCSHFRSKLQSRCLVRCARTLVGQRLRECCVCAENPLINKSNWAPSRESLSCDTCWQDKKTAGSWNRQPKRVVLSKKTCVAMELQRLLQQVIVTVSDQAKCVHNKQFTNSS